MKDFETILPPLLRNRCFSSRLEDITRFTAKTHFLLEFAKKWNPSIESIGIGDRGNEIGSGKIPWEVFKELAITNREPVFCCRLKTDHFISCGISNWGGYALMAGVALAKGRLDVLEKISPEQEGRSTIWNNTLFVESLALRQGASQILGVSKCDSLEDKPQVSSGSLGNKALW